MDNVRSLIKHLLSWMDPHSALTDLIWTCLTDFAAM